MARTLKLDCITIRVNRKGTEEPLLFDEFFLHKESDGTTHRRPFADFFSKYVQSFNGAFAAVGSTSKAIYLDSSKIEARLRSRFIYGVVTGGNSGARVDVMDTGRAGHVLFPIQPNHVGSEPFHFLLWMPANFEVGILLLQGYSNASVADAFKHHLASFFRRECPDAVLNTGAYVGPATVSRFQAESVVDKITLRRTRVAADVAEHLIKGLRIDATTSKVTVEVKISGLNTLSGFDELMQRWIAGGAEIGGLIEMEDLQPVGMDEEHETIIGYKDKDGRQVSSRKGQNFELKPQFYIDPSDVATGADGRPDPDQIKAFMVRELERIKEEIGFTTTNSAS